ncbi:hypothetical protein M2140_001748 [Clostridiales Family XIII bacterium PM5-7]
MDTIIGYLNSMFAQFPETEAVIKAKADMAAMMEDKYTELKAEGKSENEAIGVVISEFGNIDELARELGFVEQSTTGAAEHEEEPIHRVSLSDATEYLETSNYAIKRIAHGVSLCICSPILLIVLGGLSEERLLFRENTGGLIGLVIMFLMIAIAVPIFIMNGTRLSRYEYLQKEVFQLEPGVDRVIRQMKNDTDVHFGVRLGVGVTLCIISVIPVFISGFLVESSDIPACIAIGVMLAIIAVAVNIIITTGTERERFSILLQEGEFSKRNKNGSNLSDAIASIYWPVIVACYLGYSFITNDWGRSWIIWPVAGVTFAAIMGICNLVKKH